MKLASGFRDEDITVSGDPTNKLTDWKNRVANDKDGKTIAFFYCGPCFRGGGGRLDSALDAVREGADELIEHVSGTPLLVLTV